MAPPRPHGSRFSKDRPEPTSRLFRSMRPFARILILASFFMMVSDLSVGDLSDEESVEISDYQMVSFNFFLSEFIFLFLVEPLTSRNISHQAT
jgi:hypothetical protein